MADPLEISGVEKPVCDYAESKYGYIPVKLNIRGRRGFPDRLFIGRMRSIFFIEFKRKNRPVEPLQDFYHKILRKMGVQVYVVDTKEKGFAIIDQEAKKFMDKEEEKERNKVRRKGRG